MKTKNIILIAGAGLLAYALMSGKIGQTVAKASQQAGVNTGQAIGGGAGGIISGVVEGVAESVTVQPYEWAKQHGGYIPVIDDVAYSVAWLQAGMKTPAGATRYEGVLKQPLQLAGAVKERIATTTHWYDFLNPYTLSQKLF